MIRQKPSLLRALQVLAFNTVIALGITLFMGSGFWFNLVYSQCIGLLIWAGVDFGQYWLITDLSRQWRRLFLLVPVCAALGYAAGTLLASSLLPQHTELQWSHPPNQIFGFLVLSLMAGGISTYFFMSREQLANARADMARTQSAMEAAQHQMVQAQLQLLQSQLEPHMLFNTLANLRALIALDPPRAQIMLDHMVAYLRATLGASRVTRHPLATEFERLRDYLELIAVRMGPRLRYTLDLPSELADLSIPPLLMQPLVENAIRHGLEPKVEGGTVHVHARRRGSCVSLCVEDTGIGLTQSHSNPNGYGLSHVRERLISTYGPQSTLEIRVTNSGTTRTTATFYI